MFGGISAAAFYGIGAHFTAVTGLAEGGLGHILTHGLAGGILAELQGGQFGHGFLAAGLSKAVMGRFNYDDLSAPAVMGRTAIAAIVGGSISRITGGKFANGALTSAMAQLFNAETHARNQAKLRYDNDIEAALKELRQTSKFNLMEAAAKARLGRSIEYRLISGLRSDGDGNRIPNLPWADTEAGIVYIPRGFAARASFLSGSDRIKFSLQRVIFHEVYHQAYTYGIEFSHYSQTIVPTNTFMSNNYGQRMRTVDSVCIGSNCRGPFAIESTR